MLDLVFLWHMHQPDYRNHLCPAQAATRRSGEGEKIGPDEGSGSFVLPWVYLHALKDYSDMAAHLERHPEIRAVINFVPVLLDQIEDYVAQFDSGEFRDPLLQLLARADLNELDSASRDFLLQTCFRSNHQTMLAPFPHYQRLHDIQQELNRHGRETLSYLSGSYFADLITWYHLAWTGETLRRSQSLINTLLSKGSGYTLADRQALLQLIGQTLRELIPRYRALAERGQIELSTTPATHPLAPLLLDFQVAHDSQPDAPLPLTPHYPGGRSRVEAQLAAAQRSHTQRFGQPAVGIWPAEGAVSPAHVEQLAAHGCRWIASGEGVLRGSLHKAEAGAGIQTDAEAGTSNSAANARAAYRPWQLASVPGATLFFRDEKLSDMIGFEYAQWHGRDAAQHFVDALELIHTATPPGERAVVSIIMDGENAWEHYPYNAFHFFEDLYSLLEQHPQIRTTTYQTLLADPGLTPDSLPCLQSGSWVHGSLSTWIGDADKNRAWDLLCAAKRSHDLVMAGEQLSPAQRVAATAQLAVCESSDWFWWFGDYNPADTVALFDQLFRRNLANLYQLLQLPAPAQLDEPIARRQSENAASQLLSGSGAMRRAQTSG